MPEKTVNDKIKKLRLSLNLSQQKFANLIGITRSTVNDYEHNICNPSEKTLLKICKKLNLPTVYFK